MRACVCVRASKETTTKSIITSESQSHCNTNKPVIHIKHLDCNRDPAHNHCISILYSLIPRSPWRTPSHTVHTTIRCRCCCRCCLLLFFFPLLFRLSSLRSPKMNLYEVYRTRALLFTCIGVCYIHGPWNRHTHTYKRANVYDFKNPDEMCEKEIKYKWRLCQTEMELFFFFVQKTGI